MIGAGGNRSTTSDGAKRLRTLDLIDAHAGGDIGRVIVGGVVDLPAATVAERARRLQRDADGLRRLLTQKPHGDPSQCVNLVVPPSAPNADAGLVIMGTMGYPGFSGSNAMCTAAALVEARLLPLPEPERDLVLETPAGLTRLTLTARDGRLDAVAYDALPGFAIPGVHSAHVEGWGRVRFRLVHGGVFYAVVDAVDVGLDPARATVSELTRFFDALFTQVVPNLELAHPEHGAMPPLSLGLLAGPLQADPGGTPRVDVAVYMEGGVICAGPTGTGTTALLVWLHERGQLAPGAGVRAVSPSGQEFVGTLTDTVTVGDRPGARTRIAGRPYLLARSRIIVDFDDPLIDERGLAEILA
ncbi:proline racemase family protein [Pseudonocardia sp. MH-G8]|uniref:proline racemase family protein n=1 Tax=Pseudonocardia sp. MH-G8 TaxID=1854588 RepID=UPI0013046AA0|nr:proline racemase family protein [Pseudonocardia sp. MH-G8]